MIFRYIKNIISSVAQKQCCALDKRDAIYVLGDSHSLFWSGQKDVMRKDFFNDIRTPVYEKSPFRIFHLGACLAYGCAQPGRSTHVFEKILFLIDRGHIEQGSFVMPVLGEIDIRFHVFSKGQAHCLERLKAAVNDYVSLCFFLKKNGFRVIATAPVASAKDSWLSESISQMRFGSERDRNIATILFKAMLEKSLQGSGMPIFSLLDILIDSNFETKECMSNDECHLTYKFYDKARLLLFDLLHSNYGIAVK